MVVDMVRVAKRTRRIQRAVHTLPEGHLARAWILWSSDRSIVRALLTSLLYVKFSAKRRLAALQ